MAKSKSKEREASGPRPLDNRRARYDYEFVETFEAGIALVGSEVKSIFRGKANMTDAYCKVDGRELWLFELDIEPYDHASAFAPPRRRPRKLLMHRKEIDLLDRKSSEKGLALIPSRIYFKNGKVKVQVALARGKREYDKREAIAKREERREVERVRSFRR